MNTTSVETEMSLINMDDIIKQMNRYAHYKLDRIDSKQLEGLTADDVVQDTILKVLEGSRSWEKSKLNNFTTFLFGCLKSEISHIQRRIENRGNAMWRVKEYLFSYNEAGIKFDGNTRRYYVEE